MPVDFSSFVSYLNPLSERHHAWSNISKLDTSKKIFTVFVSALAALATFYVGGLGGVAAFRLLTERYISQISVSSASGGTASKTASVASSSGVGGGSSSSGAADGGAGVGQGSGAAAAAAAVDSLTKRSSEDDEVGAFWAHVSNKPFITVMHLYLNMSREDVNGHPEVIPLDEKISLILSDYQSNTTITLSAEAIKQIRAEFVVQCGEAFNVELTKELPDRRTLKILPTYGDGTCAFHALFATWHEGSRTYRLAAEGKTTDQAAADKRNEFCQKLRDLKGRDNLPEQIKNVLTDYFDHLDIAPSSIQRQTRDSVGSFKKKLDQMRSERLSVEIVDSEKEKFLLSDDFFEPYLEHIANVGTYLLQDEVAAIGVIYNINITLHQPSWSELHRRPQERLKGAIDSFPLTSGYAGPVYHVCYNGHNHYAKADVVAQQ